MVRIADHHKPGAWRHDPSFEPSCAWPEECYVQWGGGGLVLRKDGSSYRTAFFEAFPGDNAGGFIRGEGPTIAEAEAAAFAKWSRQVLCEHRWCRKGYENGGAICARCGAFKTVFKPIYRLGEWQRPITGAQASLIEDFPGYDEDSRRHFRKLELRKNAFGVESSTAPMTRMEAFIQNILGEDRG
jgi:hypothetical protein